jgi:hypothetical protein
VGNLLNGHARAGHDRDERVPQLAPSRGSSFAAAISAAADNP